MNWLFEAVSDETRRGSISTVNYTEIFQDVGCLDVEQAIAL